MEGEPGRPTQADAPASTDMGAERVEDAGGAQRPGDEAPPDRPAAGEDVCPECEGSGRLDGEPCSNCGGTGKVTGAVGGG